MYMVYMYVSLYIYMPWQKRGDTATFSQKGNDPLQKTFIFDPLNLADRIIMF